MSVPITRLLPLITLRRERILPVAGRVVAQLDQKVTAMDIIAEANFGHAHIMLDVAGKLGIPAEIADSLIQVRIGDHIEEGQIIASHRGLFTRNIRAPRGGRVEVASNGRILLDISEGVYELHAGMPGIITRVIQNRGTEITMTGTLIEGVWGNGRMDIGLLLSPTPTSGSPLTVNQLDVSLRSAVVLCGTCQEAAVLLAANDLPVRGMILGGISSALLPIARQVKYPIVVLDGLDARAMNAAAFRLLTANVKNEVTVNAQPFDRYLGSRPEIFIPHSVSEPPPPPPSIGTLTPGQQVRLLRAPYAGLVGVLGTLLPGLTVMPNGLRQPGAEVRLEGGGQVVVPLANLEVLG